MFFCCSMPLWILLSHFASSVTIPRLLNYLSAFITMRWFSWSSYVQENPFRFVGWKLKFIKKGQSSSFWSKAQKCNHEILRNPILVLLMKWIFIQKGTIYYGMKNASVVFNHHAIFDYNLKSVYDKKKLCYSIMKLSSPCNVSWKLWWHMNKSCSCNIWEICQSWKK